MASAGRILIMPKGTYNANTTYEMLDLVYYNGTSWLAKKTATGIEPSNANSEYWQQMSDFSFIDEKKQDKEKTTVTIPAGGSYKYWLGNGECCLLCAYFNNKNYAVTYVCCGINEWSYNITKLNQSVYDTSLYSETGQVLGEDLNSIIFNNDTEIDEDLTIVKLPFRK